MPKRSKVEGIREEERERLKEGGKAGRQKKEGKEEREKNLKA